MISSPEGAADSFIPSGRCALGTLAQSSHEVDIAKVGPEGAWMNLT
jgi:hypothetical protein